MNLFDFVRGTVSFFPRAIYRYQCYIIIRIFSPSVGRARILVHITDCAIRVIRPGIRGRKITLHRYLRVRIEHNTILLLIYMRSGHERRSTCMKKYTIINNTIIMGLSRTRPRPSAPIPRGLHNAFADGIHVYTLLVDSTPTSKLPEIDLRPSHIAYEPRIWLFS